MVTACRVSYLFPHFSGSSANPRSLRPNASPPGLRSSAKAAHAFVFERQLVSNLVELSNDALTVRHRSITGDELAGVIFGNAPLPVQKFAEGCYFEVKVEAGLVLIPLPPGSNGLSLRLCFYVLLAQSSGYKQDPASESLVCLSGIPRISPVAPPPCIPASSSPSIHQLITPIHMHQLEPRYPSSRHPYVYPPAQA